MVLGALGFHLFEPLFSLDLWLLCLKTAFLLDIVSAKWVRELSALSVDPACLRLRDGDHPEFKSDDDACPVPPHLYQHV